MFYGGVRSLGLSQRTVRNMDSGRDVCQPLQIAVSLFVLRILASGQSTKRRKPVAQFTLLQRVRCQNLGNRDGGEKAVTGIYVGLALGAVGCLVGSLIWCRLLRYGEEKKLIRRGGRDGLPDREERSEEHDL